MTITKRVMDIIDGQSYLNSDGLTNYHTAQSVKAALRRKDALSRLSGVREALNKYRVTAWLTEEGRIEFRRNGKAELIL